MQEKITSLEAVRTWPGEMPVSHRYTAGLGGERFFRALKDDGVFLATSCEACGVTYCPARAFCERCLAGLDDYIKVGPKGVLDSFTIVYFDLDEQLLSEPIVVGLIKLDGADTHLVHRIQEGAKASLEIGMKVEPKFLPKAERTGSLNDIVHFAPSSDPSR